MKNKAELDTCPKMQESKSFLTLTSNMLLLD